MIYIDAHLHGRIPDSPEFNQVVPTYTCYSAAVYMMNFQAPLNIFDAGRAVDELWKYRDAIMAVANQCGNNHHVPYFMPVMAESWTSKKLKKFIARVRREDFPMAGLKMFCPGQSTNAGNLSIDDAIPLIDVAAKEGVPVAFHMEDPNEPDPFKKEESAIDNILPKLITRDDYIMDGKFSLEHISTAKGLNYARGWDLNYTITPHHLAFSLERLGIKGTGKDAERELRTNYPFFYCKPLIQTEKNRAALTAAFLEMDLHHMPGSDSAPHIASKKTQTDIDKRPAGIYMGDSREAYEFATEQKYNTNLRGLHLHGWNGARDVGMEEYLSALSMNAALFYNIDVKKLSNAKPLRRDEQNMVINILRTALQAQY